MSNGRLSAPGLLEIPVDGYSVTWKPPADRTNSSTPSPAHKLQYRVSGGTFPAACHLIPSLIATLRILRGAMQALRRITGWGRGPQHSQHACQPPTLPVPTANNDLSTSANQSRNSPLWKRVSLGQSSVQNSKDSLTKTGSRPHDFCFCQSSGIQVGLGAA